jgi:hypothetical protein
MKAKFFSTKFFFCLVVVFAVICLFVVFYGVVRANEPEASRVITIGLSNVPALHRVVEGVNTVPHVHQDIVDDHMVVSYSNMQEQVDVHNAHEHLAVGTHIVEHVPQSVVANGVMNGVEEV